MIDLFDIPNSLNHQVFFTITNDDSSTWQTWTKPRNAKFIFMTAIGGGGGGACGSTSSTSGGGGGGSASMSKLIVPANLIPDILYIRVGFGGRGCIDPNDIFGSASFGTRSTISISPYFGPIETEVPYILLSSESEQRSAPSDDEIGGAGGGPFTTSDGVLASLGIFQSIQGVIGGDGSIGQPLNITISDIPLTGGGGGAGIGVGQSLSGASIIGISEMVPTIFGGSAGGGSGSSGHQKIISNLTSQRLPFISTGGAGGGSNISGIGGNGGDGGFGCGGGGGGAGSGGFGLGGKGGDGIVTITCF